MLDFSQIIYTLPTQTHSACIAAKTPTGSYICQPKYIPDYGGVVDNTKSCLKSNSLLSPHPHLQDSKPRIIYDQNAIETAHYPYKDCMFVVNDTIPTELEPNERLYTLIYSNGCTLHFKSIYRNGEEKRPFDIWSTDFETPITSIKRENDFLLVNTLNSVYMYKLNAQLIDLRYLKEFAIDERIEDDGIEQDPLIDQTVVKYLNNIKTRRGQVTDSTMSKFNPNIVGTASNIKDTCAIKLFDVQGNLSRPFYQLSWLNNELDDSMTDRLSITNARKFRAIDNCEKPLNLHHSQYHISHLVATTTHQIFVVDPRMNCKGLIIADIFSIPSFLPIERYKTTHCSLRNSHQLYSLSNVQLRVFDKRYPGVPLSQLNHMLESDLDRITGLNIVQNCESHETLLAHCAGRVCFVTFDREPRNRLQNPKSLHPPYHNQMIDSDIIGLDTIPTPEITKKKYSFELLFLDRAANIYTARYSAEPPKKLRKETCIDQFSSSINVARNIGLIDIISEDDLRASVVGKEVEKEFESERATKSFLKMKNLFDKPRPSF